MSAAVAFDTLKFVKRLEAGGFTQSQASAAAEAFAEATSQELATKTELKAEFAALRSDLKAEFTALRSEITAVRSELETKIAEVRSESRENKLGLEAKIEASKAELVKWMFGTVGFQTLVVLGAVLALSKFMHP
ncbi:CCDC90 family protein [Methylosinus sp. Sm6]|uniref:CCDC90 family protein n=1 Tax=Methylosinus sp. Sm6 TaxID=2866948 RepID=UPI001C9996B4|nr:CCDC90 family protein [Methylosinus sp. Sm6]MBY6240773.1 CCDC90 family protein [Methylosinus sp. Sm6]